MALFYKLIGVFCLTLTSVDSINIKNFQNQPKILVTGGDLHFYIPHDKYIKFHTPNFHINEYEVLSTLQGAENASRTLQYYERFMTGYQGKIDDIQHTLLNMKLSGGGNSTNTSTDPTMYMRFRRMDRRITALQRSISSLRVLLTKDDCASNPCKNGGVCTDIFNGFLCQCQSGWEGPGCEKDIDECTRYKGTDLGCQNGGTCQNLPGTFQCYCQNGWVGLLCNRKPTDCTSGSAGICGYGTCVPQNNKAGYKCICDPGWTTDGTNPSCSVDVDECKLPHPPCSTDPLVLCTNVPGSFVCQHCPPGYTGTGYYCSDVNECQLFNGGCSVSPFVECINIPGSSKCGPCPPGYQGDGKMCSYRGVCNINNGGCSLLARCMDNPAISETYVQCLCPPGYSGQGVGPNGCFRTNFNSTSCFPNPCVHGTCATNNSPQGFACICDQRYSGTYCEHENDPCATNPCQNGGTCQKRRGRFICKCPSGFTGKLCNQERQACGESITLSNGTLTYPPTDFAISRGSESISCAWTIRTDESMVIQINFTKFNIVSDSSCSSQWFQIHDGKNSLATPLGRYCGTTLPLNGTVTTTHNMVYFWLRSNGQGARRPEFQITWMAKKPECGFQITGGTGMIVSPGWPNNYPNNRDCYWHFHVPSNKRLLFHVYSLNIGHDSDCTGDILEFYTTSVNGLRYIRATLVHANNQLFANFCNSTIPEPFYSTYYRGYIHFKSNEKNTYSGFQIGYSTVNGIPGCGDTYTNKEGYIQSIQVTPSMPLPLICAYEIKMPENTTIKLEFVEMNLEQNCDLTNVAIYQGTSTDSALIGKYCGSTLPGPIITFGNKVLIQSTFTMWFKTQWKIKYETICSLRFTDPVKSFTSTSGECAYHIEQPAGNIISLDLELTGVFFNNRDCIPYYVEVRDGDTQNSTLIGRYCQRGVKYKIESSTNYLYIKARLTFGILGFNASYTTLDMGCGGILKKDPGTISFPPQGTGKYAGNKKCRWVIEAPNDKVVQITWMTFHLEQSFDCTYDHINVFDNNTGIGMGGSMGRYCGFNSPPQMLTSSNIMTIDFVSDNTIHGDGFLASYTFIKENNVCGANYFTSAGVIKTPGYPNNYPTNRECVWIITVQPGNQILLNVTDFNVEAYSSCRYDWLEIRNGGTSSSPLIGRYCGTTIPKLIPSHANKLYLKFNSDMSRSSTGFKIQFSSTTTGCGGTLTSPSGSIMSPHYPEPYTKNTDCLWKIVVSAGSKIQIIFADIDLEKHSVCGLDYVQLLDGPTINSNSLGKFCSPQTALIISSENTMLVRFRSDVSFQGRGFHIQYSALCTNTLTGFGGVIESPNFPNDYPQDQNCLWDIIVAEKNKINITFSHFALERSTTFENKSCQFDYVEIEYQDDNSNDGSDVPQYQKYGRYCGYSNPGLITLNSHYARIHFVSDSLLLGTGFRLEWKLFGCGGILTEESGKITSPNYPKPYPASIECNWVITVPLGKSVQIKFNEISVEKDGVCTYDFIKLYDGKDASYQLLTTFCYQTEPTTVTSTGNNMFINFKADSSYQGTGFEAYYNTELTNCGGALTAPSGYVFSPNYPKNYNKNETCEWLISTNEHHTIELQFEDVDLVRMDCNKTYIKVFDGPTQAYPVLETVCGGSTGTNRTIKSTYENLFIEFRSDSFITSKGFKAKYQQACGANIKTSGSGNLRIIKDAISTVTDSSGNCSYTIQSEDKSKHVTLTITYMGNTGWCDGEYTAIKIYNGPFSDSPLIGSYCGSKIPPAIVSDGSALHIEFNQAMDLFATYSVLDDQCGGELIAQEGALATPGWPKSYPNNIECAWTISIGPGNEITLNVLNLDIPESDHCNTDFLEIRETNATGKLLGVYCGTNTPSNLTAYGKIYLLFKSSRLGEGIPTTNKGFNAEYSTATDNKINGTEGLIGSPHYPGPIAAYGSYSWLVTTKPGTRIEITFLDFFMEIGYDDEDCSASPFKIYDGMDMEAESLLHHCGGGLPAPTISSFNIIYIFLDYYTNRLESKFLLQWKSITVAKKNTPSNKTSDCNLYYALDSPGNKTISSPGYPNGYAQNLNCEWVFETPQQYHIKLRILDRNFGTWGSFRVCSYADVVKVYQKLEKNGQWEMIKEICNNSNTFEDVVGTNLVKVEFVTNKYINGSGFQAQAFAVCGGVLTEPKAYITLNSSSHTQKECQWNITVKSGRTIKLNFESFDVSPNDPNNCKNYLIIRNGKFPDSPFLGNGKFCGPEVPPQMESTSNHLYLKYTGRSPVKGFKLSYEEVSISCGGNIQLSLDESSTEISSPNYPNIPAVHTECIWTFRAPPGESLRVDFEERFDISDRHVCNKDYLELRDGGTELSPLIGTYCYEIPSTQYTTDNMLRMKFFTDSDETRNGFKAKVSISYCGGTIRGLDGALSSKTPHAIRSGSNCTWYLRAPPGYRLNINFPSFHVSTHSPNCSRDDISKVYLYEHNSIFENVTMLGVYCGQISTNETIRVGSDKVVVNYLSKADQDEFSLTFKAVKEECGGILNEESGTITSPGYPHAIYKDIYCFWRIKVPRGRRITFLLDDVDLDNTYLAIFEGLVDGPRLVQSFANKPNTGDTYETNDNTGHILFWQELQSNKRGFKISFTSNKPSLCIGDFNQTNGDISAPLNVTSYKCEWVHTKKAADETVAIKVIIQTNNTKLGNLCRRFDTGIHIYYPEGYIAKICRPSKNNPYEFRSIYDVTNLIARRNLNSQFNFTISYKTYKCGAIIRNQEQGTISSPNFPNNPSTTMECSWLIYVEAEHRIKLNITTLNLGNDCDKSYLIIYNGVSPDKPRIGMYCKNTKPDLIITEGHGVLIDYKYEIGGDGSSKGFSLNYEPEIHGCGGIYHQQSDIIQTPNYGKDYPNNAECLWEIRAEDGNLVKLKFYDRFYIEESENCANDYVEIFEWKDATWVSLGKKCGRNLPQETVSTSRQLRVLFRSNDKITASGFKATWSWHCGGVLEATKQKHTLMSPGYPNSKNANCTYKITTRNGKGIVNIQFQDFITGEGETCSTSNLTVNGVGFGRNFATNQQVYCEKNKPGNQRFRGSVFITYLNSRAYSWIPSGFKLTYSDESCGGNITSPTIIETPETNTQQSAAIYRMYQPRISCTWYITAPPNQIPVLSIHKLDMSLTLNCLAQTLEVYDGLVVQQSKRLATLCGKIEDSTKPIPSKSNTMLVKIESTPFNFEGFQGEVYFTYGPSVGCGGTINLTDTKYLSAPNNLPHMDCHWTIIAPRHKRLQLEFTKIQISGACNNPVRNHTYFCTCSYIEVRDGGGPFADQMAKLCSSDTNTKRTFTTSWTTAYIRLYTAVAQNDMFSVTITPVESKCGSSELSVTNDRQVLTSPDYPNNYPHEIKCTWVLTNSNTQGRITLYFEDFDLLDEPSSPTDSCDDDRVLITDDPNRHIITEGYGPRAKFNVQTPTYNRLSYNQFSFCGKAQKPFDLYSAGNSLTVSFISYPSSKKGKGFKLTYGASGCNRTIIANEGRVQSSYTDKNNCIITITADTNRTLSIYFLSFYIIYSDVNCTNNGLEIRENNATGPQLLKACGARTPSPIFSNSNQLYIRAYNRRGTNIFSQYNFLFLSSDQGKGCGGKLYNFRGKFSSPMYPNAYREDIECTWEVKVPRGYKVALKFTDFDIGGACYKNKVLVTTDSGDVPVEHEFCPEDTPATLYSNNVIKVKYYSSVNNGGNGWLALFQAVKEESDTLLWF